MSGRAYRAPATIGLVLALAGCPPKAPEPEVQIFCEPHVLAFGETGTVKVTGKHLSGPLPVKLLADGGDLGLTSAYVYPEPHDAYTKDPEIAFTSTQTGFATVWADWRDSRGLARQVSCGFLLGEPDWPDASPDAAPDGPAPEAETAPEGAPEVGPDVGADVGADAEAAGLPACADLGGIALALAGDHTECATLWAQSNVELELGQVGDGLYCTGQACWATATPDGLLSLEPARLSAKLGALGCIPAAVEVDVLSSQWGGRIALVGPGGTVASVDLDNGTPSLTAAPGSFDEVQIDGCQAVVTKLQVH